MNLRLLPTLALGATLLLVAAAPQAQQAPRPEALIKWRQSAYQVVAWNTGRIKAAVDGTYNKDEVVQAANAIAAIANSGLNTLFVPGTETGKGWRDTTVKPALFTDGARVGELAGDFTQAANELVRVAATGNPAAVKDQHGKLTRTCKACHDAYRRIE